MLNTIRDNYNELQWIKIKLNQIDTVLKTHNKEFNEIKTLLSDILLQPQNKEKNLSTKNELLQQMAVILGGRCSESVFLDDITTGASNDLEKLRKLAKLYVGYYGLSDKLKNLNITDDILSDKTKQLIDTEIQKLINDVEIYTTKILEDNKDNIKKMVKLLLKNEDVSGNELRIILGKKLESSINKFMIKI